MLSAYAEEEVNGEPRTVMHLHPRLAPTKVAVLPLSKKEDLVPLTNEIASALRPHFQIDTDTAGAIGRRYRRQDEVGTPYCITVDFDSLEDHAVTLRERDSMNQERIPVDTLLGELRSRFD
jgi:glycyl-tRNA synthetase